MNLSDRIIDEFFQNIGRDSSGRRIHKRITIFSNLIYNRNNEMDNYGIYSTENEFIFIPEHLVKSLIHSGVNTNKWYRNEFNKELNIEFNNEAKPESMNL